MTCIVGIVDGNTVYIGGDSAGVSGLDITIRKDKKVFTNGEFVMGFTSSFRMGQVLQYDFKPPKIRESEDDLMAYMVRKFIPAVREAFRSAGYIKVENNQEGGGCFLVGVRGRLFQVDEDFQVGEDVCGYAAVGCGERFARGSLFTSNGLMTPHERLEKALQSAAEFSGGVAPPFNHVSI